MWQVDLICGHDSVWKYATSYIALEQQCIMKAVNITHMLCYVHSLSCTQYTVLAVYFNFIHNPSTIDYISYVHNIVYTLCSKVHPIQALLCTLCCVLGTLYTALAVNTPCSYLHKLCTQYVALYALHSPGCVLYM